MPIASFLLLPKWIHPVNFYITQTFLLLLPIVGCLVSTTQSIRYITPGISEPGRGVVRIKSRRPVRLFFIFFLFFAFVSSEIEARSLIDSVSLSLEQEIGYLDYRKVIAENPPVQLPEPEAAHLQSIFNRVVAASNRKNELKFSLTVIQDNSINAFSLPGGYVFVNSGLLKFAEDDDELAGVLGHEVAHIDRNHSMKTIVRILGMSVFARFIVARSATERQQLVNRFVQCSIGIAGLGYSRELEYEADRFGVAFLEKAGYDKKGLIHFWRRYQAGDGDDSAPGFFRMFATHPPVSDRLARIEALP